MTSLLHRRLYPVIRGALIIAAVALVAAARNACATAIMIDLSNSPHITSEVDAPFDDLNGKPLMCEALALDFMWTSGNFARLFTKTSTFFNASIVLTTNGSSPLDDLLATGYLVNRDGKHIPHSGITGSASGDDVVIISLFPLWKDKSGTPNDNLARPLDFYGVHFDLTFPGVDDPALLVTGGTFGLSSLEPGGVFGIGPGIPRDIVPDFGGTLALLGMSVAGIYWIKIRFSQDPASRPTFL